MTYFGHFNQPIIHNLTTTVIACFCFINVFLTTNLQIGNFYHVYNRGNNRQTIFFERENYIYFLRLIKEHLITNAVDIVAYCLMPNHYHFLVYLRDETLSDAMKSLSLSYTKAINKRFNRSGVLFQGRFQSIEVLETDYLENKIKISHLNLNLI